MGRCFSRRADMFFRSRVALGMVALSGAAAGWSGCHDRTSATDVSGHGGHAGTGATGGMAGTTGAAGADAGGSSGAAGAGIGGDGTGAGGTAGGAAGSGAAGTAGGILLACPSSRPNGACTIDGLSCAYPTGSCLCVGGAWSCIACPPARPENGAVFSASGDLRMFFSCAYGSVTCSSPSGFSHLGGNYAYWSNAWACGVCPATHPTSGTTCGNTDFECRYGDDTCQCAYSSWSCVTATCESDPAPNLSAKECNGTIGHYTCSYPSSDQTCVCGGAGERRCSCPATPLANGSPCVGFVSGTCTYGDMVCSCFGMNPAPSVWNCTVPPPPVCPATQPTSGASCSMKLDSCAYGNNFCSCDGAKWTCV